MVGAAESPRVGQCANAEVGRAGRAVRLGDARIESEGGRLTAASQIDLAVVRHAGQGRIEHLEITVEPLGPPFGIREAGRGVRVRDARQLHGLFGEAVERLGRKVGGVSDGRPPADEDAQAERARARLH